MNQQEILDRAYALGYEYEQKHGVCPQCVLAALQETIGGIGDDVFQASHTLAGGTAITGRGTCGALVGGSMAISLRYGRDRANFEKTASRKPMELTKILYEKFVGEFGSPICAVVQESIMGRAFDLWDPNDYQAFEAAGGHVDKCPDVVGKTARWTAEILLQTDEDS